MYTTTSGLDFVLEILRDRISDKKYSYTTVVRENAGLASGVSNEIFFTNNMPIPSGFSTALRAGRWYYTEYSSDAETASKRGYIFSVASGSFRIPSVAIAAESGAAISLSYTWLEEQPYKFSDEQLKLYIADSISTVNNVYYDFGYQFISNGLSDMYISPDINSSDLAPYIYAKYCSYLIKKELEAEGFADRIYLRDINITIDTSKGLGDLTKSAQGLLDEFKSIISELRSSGVEAAFARIDTYSTERIPIDYNYQHNFISDEDV